MKSKVFFRLILAVFFGAVGILIVKAVPPPELFVALGDLFFLVAALAFGILGFISVDLLRLAGRAGIAALASQIAGYIPIPGDISVPSIFAGKRRSSKKKPDKFVNPMLIDTSVLIDGRFIEVAKTGFVFGTLIVMPSVIDELHRLADNPDEGKRTRGRRGLDNLQILQHDKNIKTQLISNEPKDGGVDAKLIALAKNLRAKIVTVDFNLNKVAKINRIPVLNINELVNAVKTPVLPSDRMTIKITAVGREKDQGVGYLADGTMVVVESGSKLVGKTVEVVVAKVLQTAAGKMVFAKISNF